MNEQDNKPKGEPSGSPQAADTSDAGESVVRNYAASGDRGSEFETREVPALNDEEDDPGQTKYPPSSESDGSESVFKVVVDGRRPGSILDTKVLHNDNVPEAPDEFETGIKVPVDAQRPGSDSSTVTITRDAVEPSDETDTDTVRAPRGADNFDDLETREVPVLREEWRDRAAKVAESLGETAEVVGAWEDDEGDSSLAHSVAVASGAFPLPENERPAAIAGSVLEKAREAQRAWAALRFEQRMPKFDALRKELVFQRGDYVPSMATAIGRPMVETLTGEYIPVLEALRTLEDIFPPLLVEWHAGAAALAADGQSACVRMVPWGIVVVVNPPMAPFGFPMAVAIDALAAGNAVIVCASEQHPRVSETMRKMFQRAGFAEHLVQVVSGAPETVLATIDAAPDKFIFFGDTEVAAKLSARCTSLGVEFQHVRPGKDTLLVLPDAPLDRAVHAAIWGAFASGGLLPGSIERVVVAASLYDQFRMRFVEAIRAMNSHHAQLATIGESFNPRRFQMLMDDAVAHGARATWPAGEEPGRWIHWKAVVVENVGATAKLSRERLEGPGAALYRSEKPADDIRSLLSQAPAGTLSVLGKPSRELRTELERMPVARLLFQDVFPSTAGSRSVLGPELPRTMCSPASMLRPMVVGDGDPVAGRVGWFPYTDDKAYALMEAIEAAYGLETGKRIKAALRLALNPSKRKLLRGDNS
ncbi:MAG: aldehyde dehydrogenase family protein [Planctomycetes bacterium]|nr:aldehyde dehydrogenase family protein [Planctomycetota bacterium]